jgi:hypothetical protein
MTQPHQSASAADPLTRGQPRSHGVSRPGLPSLPLFAADVGCWSLRPIAPHDASPNRIAELSFCGCGTAARSTLMPGLQPGCGS